MTNVSFLWENLWDLGTLTPSTENPLFPAINTQHRWHTRTWRSVVNSGTLTENIVINLGAALDITSFVIKNHNFSSSAVVHIQADDNPSFTNIATTGIDQNVTLYDNIMTYFWTTPKNYQYWKIDIVDTAPLTTYLEIGRVFLGEYFSPLINISNSYGKKYADPSDILFSDGGQISTNQKSRYKAMSMEFDYIGPADLALFEEFFSDRGVGREFFFTRDRDLANETTMYVRMSNEPSISHQFMEQYYHVALEIEELR